MSTRTLALDERAALCDTALALGADAPTLCGDWTVKDLLVPPAGPRAQPARVPPGSGSRPWPG